MLDQEETPSCHGELCRHNGENPDYEIACDECDYYLYCFPDWKEIIACMDNAYRNGKENINKFT